MKKYLLMFSALVVMCASSCDPKEDDEVIEPNTTVDLVFKANYGGETAVMQTEYLYPDGVDIKFVQMDFFVSNIALLEEISPNSSEIEMREIDFVNLSFTSAATAEAGHTISINKVPAGTYAGLKIGIGVPADLNRTTPSDYGSNDVLKNHHWPDWSSYIFAQIGAGADFNNDDEILIGGANSEGLSYHTGTDAVYQEVVIPRDIVLTENVDFTIDLNLDLKQVFQTNNDLHDTNNDGYLDIEEFRGTHSDGDISVSKKMMENLANSITLDF